MHICMHAHIGSKWEKNAIEREKEKKSGWVTVIMMSRGKQHIPPDVYDEKSETEQNKIDCANAIHESMHMNVGRRDGMAQHIQQHSY